MQLLAISFYRHKKPKVNKLEYTICSPADCARNELYIGPGGFFLIPIIILTLKGMAKKVVNVKAFKNKKPIKRPNKTYQH